MCVKSSSLRQSGLRAWFFVDEAQVSNEIREEEKREDVRTMRGAKGQRRWRMIDK